MMSNSINHRSIVMEKTINNMDDLYSIISLVEEKLKETSKLVLLLFDSEYNSKLHYPEHKRDQLLDVKIEHINSEDDVHQIQNVKNDSFDNNIQGDEEKLFEIPSLIPETKFDYLEISEPQVPEEALFPKSLKQEAKVYKEGNENLQTLKIRKTKTSKKRRDRKERERGLCIECGKVYADLVSHRETVHEKRIRSYICPHCDLEIKTIYYAKFFNHKQECEAKVTGVYDKYECKTCGEKFPTCKTYTNHVQTKCNKVPKKYKPHLKCSFENCTYKTGGKDRLQNHINREHLHIPVVKSFSCETCGSSYTRMVQLRNHVNTVHLNNRIFDCSICGSSFATKDMLKKHELIHSDVKKYQCPFCVKAFKQNAVLYRHKISCPLNPNR